MAATPALTSTSSPFQLSPKPLHRSLKPKPNLAALSLSKPISTFTVRAAKLPQGVEVPKVEPKLSEPFLGFTRTAEVWNSRACMMGLIGTFIVELVLHKGILQMIGVDVGKGLDLPL
ncbi:uncharacterized protein A4U43_C02F1110 [Asparagus officinalis]|uniref:Uncharacterized protein n=1 Tax=Asparagus officinalis TaxID=4686 RepID=A0A5P1FEV7_ASPOF|nr:light-harvesting complex-like protein OHP1, chloroplastic [Asparagus officinalis]ONK76905.1 uncharacterized protein A4U43_C02F1110 [Asparagus officinalis]